MKEIDGDLIKLAQEGRFDVIAHGCNCHGIMEAGIARQIKLAFPRAFLADRKTSLGDRKKLGTYSSATIQLLTMTSAPPKNLTVVNCYTQFEPGPNFDNAAMDSVMWRMAKGFPGKKIGLPKIGAGIGGGDWGIISDYIKHILDPVADVTIVNYKPA